MSKFAISNKIQRQTSEFFYEILKEKQKPIYYEHLRGYASNASGEVRMFVRRHCRGENLLLFFKRRANYFTVDYHMNIALKSAKNWKKSFTHLDDDCDDDDESLPATKKQTRANGAKKKKKVNNLNSTDRASGDAHASNVNDLPNIWLNDSSSVSESSSSSDECEIESDVQSYFYNTVNNSPTKFYYQNIHYEELPKFVVKYLKKKYSSDKIQRFFLDNFEIFRIEEDGFVSLVQFNGDENGIDVSEHIACGDMDVHAEDNIHKHSKKKKKKNVSVRESEFPPDIDLEIATTFFVKVLERKKGNVMPIESLRGHLSQASPAVKDSVCKKFKGSLFRKFFTHQPKIFRVKGKEVSLVAGYMSQLNFYHQHEETNTEAASSEVSSNRNPLQESEVINLRPFNSVSSDKYLYSSKSSLTNQTVEINPNGVEFPKIEFQGDSVIEIQDVGNRALFTRENFEQKLDSVTAPVNLTNVNNIKRDKAGNPASAAANEPANPNYVFHSKIMIANSSTTPMSNVEEILKYSLFVTHPHLDDISNPVVDKEKIDENKYPNVGEKSPNNKHGYPQDRDGLTEKTREIDKSNMSSPVSVKPLLSTDCLTKMQKQSINDGCGPPTIGKVTSNLRPNDTMSNAFSDGECKQDAICSRFIRDQKIRLNKVQGPENIPIQDTSIFSAISDDANFGVIDGFLIKNIEIVELIRKNNFFPICSDDKLTLEKRAEINAFLWTYDLFCMEHIQTCILDQCPDAVKFFQTVILDNGTPSSIMALRGKLGQTSPNILLYFQKKYSKEKFRNFFLDHDEFKVDEVGLVSLSSKKKSSDSPMPSMCDLLYTNDFDTVFATLYMTILKFCLLISRKKGAILSYLMGNFSNFSDNEKLLVKMVTGNTLSAKVENFLSLFKMIFCMTNGKVQLKSSVGMCLRFALETFILQKIVISRINGLLLDQLLHISHIIAILPKVTERVGMFLDQDTKCYQHLNLALVKNYPAGTEVADFTNHLTEALVKLLSCENSIEYSELVLRLISCDKSGNVQNLMSYCHSSILFEVLCSNNQFLCHNGKISLLKKKSSDISALVYKVHANIDVVSATSCTTTQSLDTNAKKNVTSDDKDILPTSGDMNSSTMMSKNKLLLKTNLNYMPETENQTLEQGPRSPMSDISSTENVTYCGGIHLKNSLPLSTDTQLSRFCLKPDCLEDNKIDGSANDLNVCHEIDIKSSSLLSKSDIRSDKEQGEFFENGEHTSLKQNPVLKCIFVIYDRNSEDDTFLQLLIDHPSSFARFVCRNDHHMECTNEDCVSSVETVTNGECEDAMSDVSESAEDVSEDKNVKESLKNLSLISSESENENVLNNDMDRVVCDSCSSDSSLKNDLSSISNEQPVTKKCASQRSLNSCYDDTSFHPWEENNGDSNDFKSDYLSKLSQDSECSYSDTSADSSDYMSENVQQEEPLIIPSQSDTVTNKFSEDAESLQEKEHSTIHEVRFLDSSDSCKISNNAPSDMPNHVNLLCDSGESEFQRQSPSSESSCQGHHSNSPADKDAGHLVESLLNFVKDDCFEVDAHDLGQHVGETASVDEETVVDKETIVDEETFVDEETIVDEEIIMNEASTVDEITAVDINPAAVDEAAALHGTAAVEEMAAVDETIAVDKNTSVNETTTADEAPVIDEITSMKETTTAPVVDETNSVHETAAVGKITTSIDDSSSAEETTSVDDPSSVDETTSVDDPSSADEISRRHAITDTNVDVTLPFNHCMTSHDEERCDATNIFPNVSVGQPALENGEYLAQVVLITRDMCLAEINHGDIKKLVYCTKDVFRHEKNEDPSPFHKLSISDTVKCLMFSTPCDTNLWVACLFDKVNVENGCATTMPQSLEQSQASNALSSPATRPQMTDASIQTISSGPIYHTNCLTNEW